MDECDSGAMKWRKVKYSRNIIVEKLRTKKKFWRKSKFIYFNEMNFHILYYLQNVGKMFGTIILFIFKFDFMNFMVFNGKLPKVRHINILQGENYCTQLRKCKKCRNAQKREWWKN